jgi:hypothetical protein
VRDQFQLGQQLTKLAVHLDLRLLVVDTAASISVVPVWCCTLVRYDPDRPWVMVDQQQVMVEAEDREAASSLARERTPGWTLNEWSVVKR